MAVLLSVVSSVPAQCWSSSSLSDSELANLVQSYFPTGTIQATGENIQAVAFAVAKAESRGNPTACGDCGKSRCYDSDNPDTSSIGLWQINLRWHPEYDRSSLFDPNYNAKAAQEISSNGQNWQPWSTYKNRAYQDYLDDAAQALGLGSSTQNQVTLTLYVHENSANGPTLQDVQITGQDGAGNYFDENTEYDGYVTITGVPGTWQFSASKYGYATNTWSQSITATSIKHAFIWQE